MVNFFFQKPKFEFSYFRNKDHVFNFFSYSLEGRLLFHLKACIVFFECLLPTYLCKTIENLSYLKIINA